MNEPITVPYDLADILKELKQGGYIDADRKRIVLKKRLPERW